MSWKCLRCFSRPRRGAIPVEDLQVLNTMENLQVLNNYDVLKNFLNFFKKKKNFGFKIQYFQHTNVNNWGVLILKLRALSPPRAPSNCAYATSRLRDIRERSFYLSMKSLLRFLRFFASSMSGYKKRLRTFYIEFFFFRPIDRKIWFGIRPDRSFIRTSFNPSHNS